MKKFVAIILMLLLVALGMCALLLESVDFLSSGQWSRDLWDIHQCGPVVAGWGPDRVWMRIVFGDHEGAAEKLWNGACGDSQIILWKEPAGIQIGLPPWMLGSISLLVACLMLRCWRNRSVKKDRFCRHCEADLTGNLNGVCPECGIPIDHTRPRGYARMVLDVIPWNILAPLVLIPLILAVAGYTVIPYYRGINSEGTSYLDMTGDIPVESQIPRFKGLLKKVALHWDAPGYGVETLRGMMNEHQEIRLWVKKQYGHLPGPQQHVIMSIVRNHAPTKTWPEMGPVLATAIQKDQMAIWACQALAYYDIPERKELLLEMVHHDPVRTPYHVRSGIRQFIPLYGWQEIEEPIRQSLEHGEWEIRAVAAAIVFALGDGHIRETACKVLLDSISDLKGRTAEELKAVFFELNQLEVCIDSSPFDEAVNGIRSETSDPDLRQALDSYRSRCSP